MTKEDKLEVATLILKRMKLLYPEVRSDATGLDDSEIDYLITNYAESYLEKWSE